MMTCPTQCTPGLQQLDEALTHEPVWFGKCQGTLPMHGVENAAKKQRKGPPPPHDKTSCSTLSPLQPHVTLDLALLCMHC